MITYLKLTAKELFGELKQLDFNQEYFELFNLNIFSQRDCNSKKENVYFIGVDSSNNKLVSISKFEIMHKYNYSIFFLKYIEVSSCFRGQGLLKKMINFVNSNLQENSLVVSYSYDLTELGEKSKILKKLSDNLNYPVITDFDNFYNFYSTGNKKYLKLETGE